jgi:hypothetical protein
MGYRAVALRAFYASSPWKVLPSPSDQGGYISGFRHDR